MTFATLAAAVLTVAAMQPSGAWLDAKKTPVNWNAAHAVLPARPGPRDAELAAGGRCAASVRPASLPEDRALVRRGWSLVGPYQRYGATSIVMGTASADGMCRPNGYQGFVFVNGTFAGTVSPSPMDARTDGALSNLGLNFGSATQFYATYARYSASDALCCPHASSTVTFAVKGARVVPVSVSTNTN